MAFSGVSTGGNCPKRTPSFRFEFETIKTKVYREFDE